MSSAWPQCTDPAAPRARHPVGLPACGSVGPLMTFRALTLNVWGLPWPVGRDVAARMAAIGAHLPDIDADLIACQEVWTSEARELLVAAGRRAGYEYGWHNESARSGSGLLVLAKLPLRDIRFTPYTLNGLPQRVQHSDYFGGKGFVRFTLETAAGPLTVLNTHLHARYVGKPEEDEYLGHRIAQVVEIAAATVREPGPVLLLGDFNMRAAEPEYEIFTGLTGAVDVAASLGDPRPTVLAENAYRSARGDVSPHRLDYAFVREGETRSLRPVGADVVFAEDIVLSGGEAAYSDHAGLLSEIEIVAATSPRAEPAARARALAERLLNEGRVQAEHRRRKQRLMAAGAGAVSLTTLAAAHRITRTRRGWLRSAALALPGLGLVFSLATTVLTEAFVPQELRGYDRVLATLEALA